MPTESHRQQLTFNWASKVYKTGCKETQHRLIETYFTTMSPQSTFIETLKLTENRLQQLHFNQNLHPIKEVKQPLWKIVINDWLSKHSPRRQGLRHNIDTKQAEQSCSNHYRLDSSTHAIIRAKWRFDLVWGNDTLISQRKGQPPWCPHCSLQQQPNNSQPRETRQHMLLHCPLYATARQQLAHSLYSISPSSQLTEPLLMGNFLPASRPHHCAALLQLTGHFLTIVYKARHSLAISPSHPPS